MQAVACLRKELEIGNIPEEFKGKDIHGQVISPNVIISLVVLQIIQKGN